MTGTDLELEEVQRELEIALAPGLHVLRLIGRGAMGAVFLARDPALKRHVVVKVLAPALADHPTARERFAREAEMAAAVSHPKTAFTRLPGTGGRDFGAVARNRNVLWRPW